MAAVASLEDAEAKKRDGEELYDRGEWYGAMRAFSAGAELCDGSEAGQRLKFGLWNSAAVAGFRAGDYQSVATACDAVLGMDPAYLRALYRRGLALGKLQRFTDARDDLTKVTQSTDADLAKAAQQALNDLGLDEDEDKEHLATKNEEVKEVKGMSRGFLLDRARAAKARRRRAAPVPKPKPVVSTAPVGPEASYEIQPMPMSVFTVAGAGIRSELAFQRTPATEDEVVHLPMAAALGTAVQLARNMKDDDCIAFTEAIITRTRMLYAQWGIRFDRLDNGAGPGGLTASQLRARFLALCNIGGRRCLNRCCGSTTDVRYVDKALATFATERRCCSTQTTTHRGHEAIAREAYLHRAKLLRKMKEDFGLDALRCLALDPWKEDAGKLVGTAFSSEGDAFADALAGREKWRRPGAAYKNTERDVDRYYPRRPGQKFRGLKKTSTLRFWHRQVSRHAQMQGLWARWAAVPEDWIPSAAAGNIAGGGPIHLFVFQNDGKWSGGKHICVPRTVGAVTLGAGFAKSLRIKHHSGNSFTLYLRDGTVVDAVPALPNFAWIAVGDDHSEVWKAADGKQLTPPSQRYLTPARDVAKWPITCPDIPRRHCHWIVSGRLEMLDNDMDKALEKLTRDNAVALQKANVVDPDRLVFSSENGRCFQASDGDTFRITTETAMGAARELRDTLDYFSAAAGGTMLRVPLSQQESWIKWDVLGNRLGLEGKFGDLRSASVRLARTGSLFPVHYEQNALVIAQCRGVSRYLLFDPLYHPSLYAYPEDHPFRRYSRLDDLGHVDVEQFPLAAELRGVEVELGPGDALLLPRGWWYQEHVVDEGGCPLGNVAVEFAYDEITTYASPGLALIGADLALAASTIELAASATGLDTASVVADIRAEVLNTGWQLSHDVDAGVASGKTPDETVANARFALGDLLGIDAIEFFVSRYLSAARWTGLEDYVPRRSPATTNDDVPLWTPQEEVKEEAPPAMIIKDVTAHHQEELS